MPVKSLKRSFFQRLFGKPATKPPQDPGCWSYAGGTVSVDLKRAPELGEPGGAVRLEGAALPKRVLVFHGDDGEYHAFINQCTHAKRRLDPVPDSGTIQCCSISKSTYDYSGQSCHGPGKKAISGLSVSVEADQLTIKIE